MSRTLMAADKEVPQLSDERKKALNLAITQIEKTCGKGAIMRMGADSPRVRVEGIPTGAINLDAAIGIGGIPRGRVTEMFGPGSTGRAKQTLAGGRQAQRSAGPGGGGTRDHGDPGAVRGGGRRGDRLRGGPRPQGGDRGRHGGLAPGSAGAADESGVAQAGGGDQPLAHLGGVHQSAAREDRG